MLLGGVFMPLPDLRQIVFDRSRSRRLVPTVPPDPDILELQAHRASLKQTCLNANKSLRSVSESHPTPVAVQPPQTVWIGPRSEHSKEAKREIKSLYNPTKIVKPEVKLNAQGHPRQLRTK